MIKPLPDPAPALATWFVSPAQPDQRSGKTWELQLVAAFQHSVCDGSEKCGHVIVPEQGWQVAPELEMNKVSESDPG